MENRTNKLSQYEHDALENQTSNSSWCHPHCADRCEPCGEKHPEYFVFCTKNPPHVGEKHRGGISGNHGAVFEW